MKPNTPCITSDGKDRKQGRVRYFGTVKEVHDTGFVTVALCDGTELHREAERVATYVTTPPNWNELYRQMVVPVKWLVN